MNGRKSPTNVSNKLGDSEFFLCDRKSKFRAIEFNFNCDRKKIIWAQEAFLLMPLVLHQEKGKPIQVTGTVTALHCVKCLKCIVEYWYAHLPDKPLWNWTEKNVTDFFQVTMVKTDVTEYHSSPVYSDVQFAILAQIFRVSHAAKLIGKISDGLSFPLTKEFKYLTMEPILDEVGITFEEWVQGKSHPPVPLDIAAAILSKGIELLESEEAAVALSLYTAWRQNNQHNQKWFKTKSCRLDIVQLSNLTDADPYSIKEKLKLYGVNHITKLPWAGKETFRQFRRRLIGACINIIFIQSGHRSQEFQSTVSNDRRRKRGHLFVRQTLDKSMNSLRVYRPFAELASRAAETLWNMSYIDPDIYPIPLQHSLHDTGYAHMKAADTIPSELFKAFHNMSLNYRLTAFYLSDVVPFIPEASDIHPIIRTHQFRHSFTEFVLRRFDEDVHNKLREHFVHRSEFATQIYERRKLSPAVQSMHEKNYLYELIGKAAEGKLESRFWGPAYQRLKKEIDQIQVIYPDKPEAHYSQILESIDRFTVFEWGFCVLFNSSKSEAKCHDSITGLPDVDAEASAGRCSGCPNNMGNSIQKENMIRAELAYFELAKTHPIKAIGKLCGDMAEQISRRTRS
jgi:integrase